MIQSKLPNVGTTIFTRMSQLAAECGAINLSQGFPDFDGPPELREAVGRHIAAGHNQYAPMTGLPALREQVAKKIEQFYGRRVSADSEVTITPGRPRRFSARSRRWSIRATKWWYSTRPTTATNPPCNSPAGVACTCRWRCRTSPSTGSAWPRPSGRVPGWSSSIPRTIPAAR